MRVHAVLTVVLLLAAALPPLANLADGGVDPKVPSGLYPADVAHPKVMFQNVTVEEGQRAELTVELSYPGRTTDVDVTIKIEIYGWGDYDSELMLAEIPEPLPTFHHTRGNGTEWDSLVWTPHEYIAAGDLITMSTEVSAPADVRHGYFRCRVLLMFGGEGNALSMGHFTAEEWRENVERVKGGGDPEGTDFLVSEGGFTAVPPHYENVSKPNKVPDFGNFTTPVIRPGEEGTYNFTVTNRYSVPITDVRVTVGFYMWATIEDAKPIEDLDDPVPVIVCEGGPRASFPFRNIPSGGTVAVRLDISTEEDTPKGTYFVRHWISFTYEGENFTMGSRGYFTWDQWEGFDYTNLYYQLGTAGIVPDSSFSVKDPVPLWPLATLIVLCVLLGALAVVFYLAEEHGDQYPRLKKGLQRLTGRWEQRKRLMRQRLDDIRASQEEERNATPPNDEDDG